MAKRKSTSQSQRPDPKGAFTIAKQQIVEARKRESTHINHRGFRCDTDGRGYANPGNRSPLRIVVDASGGFIPLWAEGVTLRWQFREQSLSHYANPSKTKEEIRKLLGEALQLWGDAVPIKFTERSDAWDFEIVVEEKDKCDKTGCVLARAFFPDQGRHQLYIYPMIFSELRQEQVETLAHELGHVFGLRHFFAQISEKRWRSEIFGKHEPFSIMNYDAKSEMSPHDRSDLKTLYQKAWAGDLKEINGTEIKLFKPYHSTE